MSGSAPGVNLSAVGLLLSPPALTGEFCPVSLWRGVERLPTRPLAPTPYPGGLAAAFTHSVRDLTADAEVIGVALSGGLDSLATLVHAASTGRRVIAFTIDMTDDRGQSTVTVVRQLLTDLGLGHVRLEVIHNADATSPPWSPLGPRRDALPELNAAVSARAASLGVDILLSGDGSDELLGVPRYATPGIARRHGIGAALRYAADVARSGPGLAGEAAAAVSRLLPADRRAAAYWAVNWPDWAQPVTTPVLAEPYRTPATDWARAWVAERIADHSTGDRSWAAADAHDAFYPHDLLVPAGEVPEASPFLTGRFLAAAHAVPLADRYGPHLPTGYWRCKALVLSLMPEHRAALPRHKQYFTRALARQAITLADAHGPLLAVETGLLDSTHLARERDPAVLLAVSAIEQWLRGAQERGIPIN